MPRRSLEHAAICEILVERYTIPVRSGPVRIGVQASSPMAAIAVRMLALIAAVRENRAPLRRIASITDRGVVER